MRELLQLAGIPGLKPSTQRVRRNILERFRAEHGRRALKDLQTTHIRSIIGARAGTPEAANNLLKILRVILNFAVAERMITGNPALVVKRYRKRGEGIHTWSEVELAQFEARHPVGSKARLALELLLGTGQRRSDVMRWVGNTSKAIASPCARRRPTSR